MKQAFHLRLGILPLLFPILLVMAPGCESESRILVFVGDSFTAGDGVPKEKTFVSLVSQALEGDTAYNRGRSGWPTTSYLRRWDEVVKKIPEGADLLFIQLGGNDLRVDGHKAETVAQCRKNMAEISRRFKAKLPEAKIILMSSVKIDPDSLTPRIREAGFGAHSNDFLERIGKEYEELAHEEGYGFIDLIPNLPKHGTHDGAHLNEVGHQAVAKVILEYLKGKP